MVYIEDERKEDAGVGDFLMSADTDGEDEEETTPPTVGGEEEEYE